jgi:hypothetical protein
MRLGMASNGITFIQTFVKNRSVDSRAEECTQTQTTRLSLPSPYKRKQLKKLKKWLRHEADLSPPSSAKVKNVWSYTSTS